MTGKLFTEWSLGCNCQVLWLRGKPGAGKTTLVSSAIDMLLSSQEQRTNAYFYCSFTEAATQESINVLGSLETQLCDAKPHLWSDVEERYHERSQKKEKLRLNELQKLIEDHCNEFSCVFMVLDAPNESPQYPDLLRCLSTLTHLSNRLRLLISTTEEASIQQLLEGFPNMTVIDIKPQNVLPDVADYVQRELQEHPTLCKLSHSLKGDIQEALLLKTDGMSVFLANSRLVSLTAYRFRWVQCQLQHLSTQLTAKAVRGALEELPPSLESTYSQILKRIPDYRMSVARDALLWLALAQTSLSLEELCEAIVIQEGVFTFDVEQRISRPEDILDCCRGLISYDKDNRLVYLAHSSVKEFLMSERLKNSSLGFFHIDETAANRTITKACLTYLRLDAFANGYCKSGGLRDRWRDWPLLQYAAFN